VAITREQAQAAQDVRNVAGEYVELLALIPELPRELLEKLDIAHQSVGFSCNAESEGQWCCLDILMLDPADYTPEKVTAANDLIERYHAQQRESKKS
jgi:hypothetical protein